jgi:hypothetical protein
MSPCGRGCGSNPGQHGDIDKEPERTGSDDDHDRDQTPGTNAGAGGRTNGRQLPPSKRVWRRYRADGDAGLVHRLRGRPKALRRKAPELRAGVLPATTSVTGTSVRRWPRRVSGVGRHFQESERKLVRARGLEPPTLAGPDPKSGASAIPPRAQPASTCAMHYRISSFCGGALQARCYNRRLRKPEGLFRFMSCHFGSGW